MDLNFFQSFLNSNAAPWLPSAASARWALHGAWAVVLAACVWRVGQSFELTWRWGLAALTLLWVLWPGPVSPAYWLGLAFQSPSLMSVALCWAWAFQERPHWALASHAVPTLAWPDVVLMVVGTVLGWVLLGDMLAWWSVSVYALGFGTPVLALVCAVALWLGVAGGVGQRAVWSLVVVLLVFVVTRWPSGNLWDALLDPWLWLVLQIKGLALLRQPRARSLRW